MSKDKKYALSKAERLIPELRFPEFVKDGDWNLKTLSEVAGYANGKAHEKNISENGQYVVVNSKYISSEGETVKYSDEALCLAEKGDTLMVLSDVPNGKAIAKCFYVNEENRFTVNQRICKISPFDCDNNLLYYIMDRNPYFLAFDDGVKQTNLRNVDVQEFTFLLPESPLEQQKIASCLSSLDELITAHNDKLQALKDRKKGLMQNLFPQEGQKVPKYRFSEFEDDGEWVEKTLIQVANYENGKAHENDIDDEGNYVVVNSKFISTEGETIKHSKTAHCPAKKGDILMVLSDVPNGRAIAKCFYVNEDNKYSVNQRICKITAFDADALFLFYTMDRNSYFLAFDDGVKQTNLRKDDVIDFPFLISNNIDEQRKISLCFSAVDELIIAQT